MNNSLGDLEAAAVEQQRYLIRQQQEIVAKEQRLRFLQQQHQLGHEQEQNMEQNWPKHQQQWNYGQQQRQPQYMLKQQQQVQQPAVDQKQLQQQLRKWEHQRVGDNPSLEQQQLVRQQHQHREQLQLFEQQRHIMQQQRNRTEPQQQDRQRWNEQKLQSQQQQAQQLPPEYLLQPNWEENPQKYHKQYQSRSDLQHLRPDYQPFVPDIDVQPNPSHLIESRQPVKSDYEQQRRRDQQRSKQPTRSDQQLAAAAIAGNRDREAMGKKLLMDNIGGFSAVNGDVARPHQRPSVSSDQHIGPSDSNRMPDNIQFLLELDAIRAQLGQKQKEFSMAVSKVDELSNRLNRLRHRQLSYDQEQQIDKLCSEVARHRKQAENLAVGSRSQQAGPVFTSNHRDETAMADAEVARIRSKLIQQRSLATTAGHGQSAIHPPGTSQSTRSSPAPFNPLDPEWDLPSSGSTDKHNQSRTITNNSNNNSSTTPGWALYSRAQPTPIFSGPTTNANTSTTGALKTPTNSLPAHHYMPPLTAAMVLPNNFHSTAALSNRFIPVDIGDDDHNSIDSMDTRSVASSAAGMDGLRGPYFTDLASTDFRGAGQTSDKRVELSYNSGMRTDDLNTTGRQRSFVVSGTQHSQEFSGGSSESARGVAAGPPSSNQSRRSSSPYDTNLAAVSATRTQPPSPKPVVMPAPLFASKTLIASTYLRRPGAAGSSMATSAGNITPGLSSAPVKAFAPFFHPPAPDSSTTLMQAVKPARSWQDLSPSQLQLADSIFTKNISNDARDFTSSENLNAARHTLSPDDATVTAVNGSMSKVIGRRMAFMSSNDIGQTIMTVNGPIRRFVGGNDRADGVARNQSTGNGNTAPTASNSSRPTVNAESSDSIQSRLPNGVVIPNHLPHDIHRLDDRIDGIRRIPAAPQYNIDQEDGAPRYKSNVPRPVRRRTSFDINDQAIQQLKPSFAAPPRLQTIVSYENVPLPAKVEASKSGSAQQINSMAGPQSLVFGQQQSDGQQLAAGQPSYNGPQKPSSVSALQFVSNEQDAIAEMQQHRMRMDNREPFRFNNNYGQGSDEAQTYGSDQKSSNHGDQLLAGEQINSNVQSSFENGQSNVNSERNRELFKNSSELRKNGQFTNFNQSQSATNGEAPASNLEAQYYSSGQEANERATQLPIISAGSVSNTSLRVCNSTEVLNNLNESNDSDLNHSPPDNVKSNTNKSMAGLSPLSNSSFSPLNVRDVVNSAWSERRQHTIAQLSSSLQPSTTSASPSASEPSIISRLIANASTEIQSQINDTFPPPPSASELTKGQFSMHASNGVDAASYNLNSLRTLALTPLNLADESDDVNENDDDDDDLAPREGEPDSFPPPPPLPVPEIVFSTPPEQGVRSILRRKPPQESPPPEAPRTQRVVFDPLTLLLDASLEGDLNQLKRILMEIDDPSKPNDEGITALHNAICAGNFSVVQLLVEHGCDVNAPDTDGWRPLHCAASCNNMAMARLLVDNGACIFAATSSDDETAAQKCEPSDPGFDACSKYLIDIELSLGIRNSGVVYAVYDYDAEHSDELDLLNGDQLTVLRRSEEPTVSGEEESGEWWWARLGKTEGFVPRNVLAISPRRTWSKRPSEL